MLPVKVLIGVPGLIEQGPGSLVGYSKPLAIGMHGREERFMPWAFQSRSWTHG